MYPHIYVQETTSDDRDDLHRKITELTNHYSHLYNDDDAAAEIEERIDSILDAHADQSKTCFPGTVNGSKIAVTITDQTVPAAEAIKIAETTVIPDVREIDDLITDTPHVIVRTPEVIVETDTPDLDHLAELMEKRNPMITTVTPPMNINGGGELTDRLKGALRGATAAHDVGDGPIQRHDGGRPPIGFEAHQGQLRPADNYEEVCTELQKVADGETTKTRAATRLDCTARTITNILDDEERRREMYQVQMRDRDAPTA